MAMDTLAQYLHIEAIQTIPPQKITAEPRPTRQVSVTDLAGSGVFERSLNVILFYNKSTEEDTGYLVAGWIKESLGNAMSELPILSGRFRILENGESEVVANDSGVRLVEGKISMSLEDFFDSKGRKNIEAKLVFWRDIDEENPHFSPLVYVQVTNFECGGYSIGISCSILLADLLMMSNFLHKWAKIHGNLMSKNEAKNLPLFYFHNHKKSKTTPTSQILDSNHGKISSQTIIYKIPRENPFELYSYKNLALLAIEKAEKQIGTKLGPEFSLFVQESTDTIKIETCEKDEVIGRTSTGHELLSAEWDELGEISFYGKNKPVHFSHWIGSRHGGGEVVIALASPDKNRVDGNNFVFIVLNNEGN